MNKESDVLNADAVISNAKLIDFGLSQSFVTKHNTHINEGEAKNSVGTLMYMSEHVLKFQKQSRRDDLISLAYTLYELQNGEGSLPWAHLLRDQSRKRRRKQSKD